MPCDRASPKEGEAGTYTEEVDEDTSQRAASQEPGGGTGTVDEESNRAGPGGPWRLLEKKKPFSGNAEAN